MISYALKRMQVTLKEFDLVKIFGTKRGAKRLATNPARRPRTDSAVSTAVAEEPQKKSFPFKGISIALLAVFLVQILYFVAIYSQNGFITKWRNIYITTAMDTLNHKWLATAFIPSDIIDDVMEQRKEALAKQDGLETSWNENDLAEKETQVIGVDLNVVSKEDRDAAVAKEAFYSLFHELDRTSFEIYLEKNPQVLDNGWGNLYINEAGLDDDGTSIRTIYDEQVLAIDAANKVLLVRAEGTGFKGVLAIAKDPSKITLQASSMLGSYGETAGVIAEKHNGLIAITASGFIDPDGVGNGGILAGYAMCDGKVHGNNHMGWGYKRLEIHEDDLMYIKDTSSAVGEGTTDAVEFQPALIINGEIVVDANCGYTGLHPRTCIGQSDKKEILMMVIEGRMPTRSVGTDVIVCAEILKQHGAMQAMNLDGGTSAMMWYDGEYVTKCSNQALPEGRPLPTAFVYERTK